MKAKARILVVDDEECIRNTFEIFLSYEGYDVTTACNYSEGLAAVAQKEFDLVIADIILGGRTGLDLLGEIRARNLQCQVIIITGDPTAGSALDALHKGVFKYIPKPVRKDELIEVTRAALNYK